MYNFLKDSTLCRHSGCGLFKSKMQKMRLTVFVLISSLVCSGLACKKDHDGYNSVLSYQNFSANAACPGGGVTINSGLDRNRNSLLDPGEIDHITTLCHGQNSLSDKQIFLSINFSANSTSTTPITGGQLVKFSKNNYPGVDSIILVANPYVDDVTNTSNVELYNITDDVPINNSKIVSSNLFSGTTFQQTGNVYGQLPDKEITLGIKFSSGTDGKFASSGSCFLILYRR
jgi:hypothetical protein